MAKKAKDTANTGRGADSFASTCAGIVSGAISVFLVILVTVFPLIYDNSYFNILETKYKCYYLSIIGMLVVALVLALIMMTVDFMEFKGEHVRGLFARLAPKNWRKTFGMADAAVLIFWLTALISTFQSKYFYEAFWGNEGRFTGLFLLTLYVASYFIISRFWEMKGWHLELFLISGMVMCLIGITDYFQMDVLRFRVNIKPEQSTLFTSTVGNINTYTAYIGLVMGFAAAMFATAKTTKKMIWYYVCMVISFFAIIMGCSDNAYLGLAGLFGLLPFALLGSRQGVRRYVVMLATFFSVIACIDVINQVYADIVIGLDSLFGVIANFGGLYAVIAVLWFLAAGYCWHDRKNGAKAAMPGAAELEARQGRRRVIAWGVFCAMVIVGVCAAFYDVNVGGNVKRYGALGSYLAFTDSWGTNRGYIWKQAVRLYGEFPPMQKLFGYGPDTFGILTTKEIYNDMVKSTGQIFDSAHNEYLQYLVTIGPIGLAAYLVFLGSTFWRMFRCRMKNPYILGALTALLCYALQALVNINLPIAAPMMWLLLSVGTAACKAAERAQQ